MKKHLRYYFLVLLSIISTHFAGAQTINPYAGTGFGTYTGDGGPATAATLYVPAGGVVVFAGNFYFADEYNHVIRRIDPYGIITTVVGDGTGAGGFFGAFHGDGGLADTARLSGPTDLTFDAAGNMYIADEFNHRIRRVDATTNIITTFAGNGSAGWTGDGGAATAAEIGYPFGITVDAGGNILFTDEFNAVIRSITPGGVISTIAGTPTVSGWSGDGGDATAAELHNPRGIRVNAGGDIFFCDYWNDRVRRISAGTISNYAGSGGSLGDGGAATAAQLNEPYFLAIDGAGNLFFTDAAHNRVRRIDAGSGIITTVAGTGTPSWSGDGGPATAAEMSYPVGIDVDCSGAIYIGDYGNFRIRKVSGVNDVPSFIKGDTAHLTVCENAFDISIDSILQIIDSDVGQRIEWRFLMEPTHGALSWYYETVTTGDTLAPVGLSYTAFAGYSGMDTFKMVVIDCAGGLDSITVYVTIDGTIVPISGPSVVCVGSTITLTDTFGGTWTSSNTAIATVGSSTGIVTGTGAGIVTITYSNSCGSVTKDITVNASPAAITGPTSVCVGSTITLSDATGGGVWSSSNTSRATVGSGTGIVTGVSAGTVTISYTLPNGCFATLLITVNPVPPVITGPLTVCVGASVTLANAAPGGTWTSSNTLVAIIGSSSGIVTGVSAGTATITYTLPTGCKRTRAITVNPIPLPITGLDTVCVGSTIVLSDATFGGMFSGGPVTIATITPTGTVTGIMIGTFIDTYTLALTGCFVTDTVTVIDSPEIMAITTSVDTVCIGGTRTYSSVTPGGIWTSSNTSIATVGSLTGIITGIALGTATITYAVANSCGTSHAMRDIHVIGMPAPPPITGYPGVCSGSTDTLYDAMPGGLWTSSNPLVATIGSSSGVVTGIMSGVVTITYTVTNMCGPTSVYRTIEVDMPPYITTNFRAACSHAELVNLGRYAISDTDCMIVCENSIVRYYANAVAGSTFTWTVTGGIVDTVYGDSIDVFWPTAGVSGTITLSSTFSHCVGSASACVFVIQKPHADFDMSADTICLNGTVVFTDRSTAGIWSSTITSWNWDFGDGSFASVEHPTHVFTVSGTDTITLVVRNMCSCTDTIRKVLYVYPVAAPVIQCPSIVCDSSTETYTTSSGCGTHDWAVMGGSILSGTGTSSITVKWDNIGDDGFGYVTLSEPCGCPYGTGIKIPVIQQNAVISGPDTVCEGQQYEYSLPLWAATQYRWGVLGHPTYIDAFGDNYKVAVTFHSPGIDTLHAWYQNRIKLCGGNVFKSVVVVPSVSIVGGTTLCLNDTVAYHLSDTTLSATWRLTTITGTIVDSSTGSSTAYINPSPAPGTYLLTATGAFCANPLTITVVTGPAAIDSLAGEDTICLNRVYRYLAFNDVPGTIYQWEAIGGTVTPSSGSSMVNVLWTSSGTKQLSVKRVSTVFPYCDGPVTYLNITQEEIHPDIVGDTLPCANSTRTYDCGFTRGEAYDWQVIPNTAGSVVTGTHGPVVTILWNDLLTVTSAAVVVKTQKCDSIITDTLNVSVQPTPMILTVSADTACPGEIITFSASSGDSAYVWVFGDGAPIAITTDTFTTHAYPINTSPTNATYTARVTGIPSTTAHCPPSGTTLITITILPGPVAHASSAKRVLCLPGDSTLAVATVTNNVTGLTYQWYDSTGIITGETDSTLWVYDSSLYYFIVTASNGCSAQSNFLAISGHCNHGHGDGGCDTLLMVTSADTCTTISLHGMAGLLPGDYWVAIDTPLGGPLPPGTDVTATYDIPGIYLFEYWGVLPGSCDATTTIADTVGIVPNFRYRVSCGVGGVDSVTLMDVSAYLPFWHIDTITWFEGSLLGGGPNVTVAFTPGSTHYITELVQGTRPGGTFSCAITDTVIVPALPFATFTDSVSPVCEGLPIYFTATGSGGVIQYLWDFGDHSGSVLQNPQRTYEWNPSADPMIDTITLTVTDSIGCTFDTTGIVRIYRKILSGFIDTNVYLCSGSVPYTLSFTLGLGSSTVTSYLWSTGDTTGSISVSESGAYWITVFDAHRCQATLPVPAVQVTVIPQPTASIIGDLTYCVGEPVVLSDYNGTGVSYEWFRNSVSVYTTPSITDPGLAAGDYEYQVILGITDSGHTCYDTSAIDTVHIYPLPPRPSISGPVAVDCSAYHLRMTASEPTTGTYNWSNGTYGATNDIYTGGPYRVWFTDLNGCINSRDTLIPLSPDFYFPFFPTGCYTICTEQLPMRLYGPPGISFNYWAWLMNGSVDLSGGPSIMTPYTIDTSGSYAWTLGNGLCTQTTDNMDVSVEDCDKCNDTTITAVITCDTTNPASFGIVVTIASPAAGTSYTLGTDVGPITPFSGTLSGTGPTSLTLTFTTLYTTVLPDSILVQVSLTMPGGGKCFFKKKFALPSCHWIAERPGQPEDSTITKPDNSKILVANSMLVFPNPTSHEVTVSYDYGSEKYAERSLAIYDMMGKKMDMYIPQDAHGNWKLNIEGWASGMYIIRMEGDGKTLQSQRLVVAGR